MTPAAALLRDGAARLAAAGIEQPRREARILLGHTAGLTATQLLTDPATPADPAPFLALLQRRVAREPMALLLGYQEFWSLRFAVSAATLIPRADSETAVGAALALAPPARVLDLGTGTGCLLLAVLSERPGAWGLGIDRVPAAAALARRNARDLGLASRAAFAAGDWATALAGGRFELVLSNPPYIPHNDIAGLMPEVARFEPPGALNGGADGLDAYRALVAALPALLASGGHAVLEVGMGQGPAVMALGAGAGLVPLACHRDLSGTQRACVLQRR